MLKRQRPGIMCVRSHKASRVDLPLVWIAVVSWIIGASMPYGVLMLHGHIRIYIVDMRRGGGGGVCGMGRGQFSHPLVVVAHDISADYPKPLLRCGGGVSSPSPNK